MASSHLTSGFPSALPSTGFAYLPPGAPAQTRLNQQVNVVLADRRAAATRGADPTARNRPDGKPLQWFAPAVQWQDMQRCATKSGGVSCWGTNIMDVREMVVDGSTPVTELSFRTKGIAAACIRPENWNETVAACPPSQFMVVVADPVTGAPSSVPLAFLLQHLGTYFPGRGLPETMDMSAPCDQTSARVGVKGVVLEPGSRFVGIGDTYGCEDSLFLYCNAQGTSLGVPENGKATFYAVVGTLATGFQLRSFIADATNIRVTDLATQVESKADADVARAAGKAVAATVGPSWLPPSLNTFALVQVPLVPLPATFTTAKPTPKTTWYGGYDGGKKKPVKSFYDYGLEKGMMKKFPVASALFSGAPVPACAPAGGGAPFPREESESEESFCSGCLEEGDADSGVGNVFESEAEASFSRPAPIPAPGCSVLEASLKASEEFMAGMASDKPPSSDEVHAEIQRIDNPFQRTLRQPAPPAMTSSVARVSTDVKDLGAAQSLSSLAARRRDLGTPLRIEIGRYVAVPSTAPKTVVAEAVNELTMNLQTLLLDGLEAPTTLSQLPLPPLPASFALPEPKAAAMVIPTPELIERRVSVSCSVPRARLAVDMLGDVDATVTQMVTSMTGGPVPEQTLRTRIARTAFHRAASLPEDVCALEFAMGMFDVRVTISQTTGPKAL